MSNAGSWSELARHSKYHIMVWCIRYINILCTSLHWSGCVSRATDICMYSVCMLPAVTATPRPPFGFWSSLFECVLVDYIQLSSFHLGFICSAPSTLLCTVCNIACIFGGKAHSQMTKHIAPPMHHPALLQGVAEVLLTELLKSGQAA